MNFIRQLDDRKVIFDRPAEILLAVGDWGTVNFHPCCLFQTQKLFPIRFDLDSFHCIFHPFSTTYYYNMYYIQRHSIILYIVLHKLTWTGLSLFRFRTKFQHVKNQNTFICLQKRKKRRKIFFTVFLFILRMSNKIQRYPMIILSIKYTCLYLTSSERQFKYQNIQEH